MTVFVWISLTLSVISIVISIYTIWMQHSIMGILDKTLDQVRWLFSHGEYTLGDKED